MIFLRIAAVCVCAAGMWWSYRLAAADNLFRRDTAESIREAIRLRPETAAYYIRLAKLDADRADDLLGKALALEPYNAQAAIELALNLEAEGQHGRTEDLLKRAFEVDRTYLGRWSLANYYFRRDNWEQFWIWARKAAEMPSSDIGPLFQLCWRVTPDAAEIDRRVVVDDASTLRQFLEFLSTKGLKSDSALRIAAAVGARLIEHGEMERDRTTALSLVNRLIDANDAADASEIWRQLEIRRWIVADLELPNNGKFARQPVQAEFDWSLPTYDGLHSWPGPAGLEVEFNGKQPETCLIAEQVVLSAAGEHEMRFSYRTKDMKPSTGLSWVAIDSATGQELARSGELLSDGFKEETMSWRVKQGPPLTRLRLEYQRPIGSPRISGLLVMQWAHIRKQ